MVGYGSSGALIPVLGPQGVYALSGLVVAGSAALCFPAIGLARPGDGARRGPPPEEATQAATHLPLT
jgi:hypothetical protein